MEMINFATKVKEQINSAIREKGNNLYDNLTEKNKN